MYYVTSDQVLKYVCDRLMAEVRVLAADLCLIVIMVTKMSLSWTLHQMMDVMTNRPILLSEEAIHAR